MKGFIDDGLIKIELRDSLVSWQYNGYNIKRLSKEKKRHLVDMLMTLTKKVFNEVKP